MICFTLSSHFIGIFNESTFSFSLCCVKMMNGFFGFTICCLFSFKFRVIKITLKNNAFLYSTFLCSACFRAIDRRKRLPQINVKIANGISRRNVSNMFNLYQNRPNKPRIPPKLKKNPIPLKLNEKFETLMPNFSQSTTNTNSGTAHNTVNTSDTKRGGRFSGSRN